VLIKEQVRKAINFDYPENIPQLLNVWYHGGTLEKYGEELKSLIARYPDDIMWHVYADVWLDWGLDVEHIPMENYATVEFIQAKKRPLKDWKKLESFLRNVPDPVKIGMFEGLGKLRQKYHNQDFRGEVCFLTGLDVRFLPKVSAQKVKESIYDEFKLFDYKKGGFIIGATNALLPDIPMENLKVMYRAIDTYRKKS